MIISIEIVCSLLKPLELDGPLINHVRLEFWWTWKKIIVCVRHVFVQKFRNIVKVTHKKNMSYKSLKKLHLLFIFLTTRLTKKKTLVHSQLITKSVTSIHIAPQSALLYYEITTSQINDIFS